MLEHAKPFERRTAHKASSFKHFNCSTTINSLGTGKNNNNNNFSAKKDKFIYVYTDLMLLK